MSNTHVILSKENFQTFQEQQEIFKKTQVLVNSQTNNEFEAYLLSRLSRHLDNFIPEPTHLPSTLLGQSIHKYRFLFGPSFYDGVTGFANFLKANPDCVILNEINEVVSHKEMMDIIVNSYQFENNPENEKNHILTPDGFLYSSSVFS